MSRAAPLPDKLQRNSLTKKKKVVEVGVSPRDAVSASVRAAVSTSCVVLVCQELVLDHVFGYRGFDCRNNLHYLNDGADIIFHTAAAVVVQNLSAGQLRVQTELLTLSVGPNQHFTLPASCLNRNPELLPGAH